MKSEPKNISDISIGRILAVVVLFGLTCLLLTAFFLYFPDHAAILGRLVATLAFAVVIVRVHQNLTASNRRKASDATESRPRRYAAIKRILLVWLALFLLNSVFL